MRGLACCLSEVIRDPMDWDYGAISAATRTTEFCWAKRAKKAGCFRYINSSFFNRLSRHWKKNSSDSRKNSKMHTNAEGSFLLFNLVLHTWFVYIYFPQLILSLHAPLSPAYMFSCGGISILHSMFSVKCAKQINVTLTLALISCIEHLQGRSGMEAGLAAYKEVQGSICGEECVHF